MGGGCGVGESVEPVSDLAESILRKLVEGQTWLEIREPFDGQPEIGLETDGYVSLTVEERDWLVGFLGLEPIE